MAAIDDLKKVEADELAEISLVAQAVTDEIARVEALLVNLQGGVSASDAAALVTQFQTHIDNLKTIAAAATAERA